LKSSLIAEAHDIQFVDLEKAVPKSLEYFKDDVHFTEAGNRKVADYFRKNIAASGAILEKFPTTQTVSLPIPTHNNQ